MSTTVLYPEYLLAFIKCVCKIKPKILTQEQVNLLRDKFGSSIIKYYNEGNGNLVKEIKDFLNNKTQVERRFRETIYVEYLIGDYCKEQSHGIILKLDRSIYTVIGYKIFSDGNIQPCDNDDLQFCEKAEFSFSRSQEEEIIRFKEIYHI
jgi:hypothetical protein